MSDYIIDPAWFYAVGVFGGLKVFIIVAGVCVSAYAAIVLMVAYMDAPGDYIKRLLLNKAKKAVLISAVTILVGILIPSEGTMYKMMIAKYITRENVSLSVDAIKDAVDYITDAMKEL